jgi:hypothetical protein
MSASARWKEHEARVAARWKAVACGVHDRVVDLSPKPGWWPDQLDVVGVFRFLELCPCAAPDRLESLRDLVVDLAEEVRDQCREQIDRCHGHPWPSVRLALQGTCVRYPPDEPASRRVPLDDLMDLGWVRLYLETPE